MRSFCTTLKSVRSNGEAAVSEEVAESDDYAMQARYQASRCARSADATLSLDWFFQFMEELIEKEEAEKGGGGNHYNSRMYKGGGNTYRPEMYATNTANGEESAMMPVEDLFLLRARSYYYSNQVQAHESRAALSPFCGSSAGRILRRVRRFDVQFLPVRSHIDDGGIRVLREHFGGICFKKCSASNCLYPRNAAI